MKKNVHLQKAYFMFLKRIIFCAIFIALANQSNLLAQSSSPIILDTLTKKKLIQPPYLKTGDTVAIVAPSGILLNREKEVNQAVELLKSWNLNVVIGEHLFNQNGHFAGTDKERTADFQKALDNQNIKAIWAARGGYGTVRILDSLNYTKFKEHPKWVIGYSDITALHNQLNNLGSESIHALMATSLTDDLEGLEQTISTFKDAIFGKQLAYTIDGSEYNKSGYASGQLVGGNLTLLHTMLGSKTSINTNGKILFFEEIGEYAYHIDRMLQSLKRAGYFENCKGIIVGDISKVRKNTTEFGRTIEEIILDAVAEYDFPVLFNFPAGHEDDNRALILGRRVELSVGKDVSEVRFINQ
ncbi:MAG: LD-carboxypeptidase [Flavobacteriaceae bacterium]|nr:LD-carboxypeptidase [Flavobacteriaceae bacterium]